HRLGDPRYKAGFIPPSVGMQKDKVVGALVNHHAGITNIAAKAVVDASGNADVAAAAGADCSMAAPDEPAVQGAGLSWIVPGKYNTNSDFQFICDHDIADTTRAFVMARSKFSQKFDVIQMPGTRERRRIVGDLTLQPQDFYANRCYNDTINIARSNFDTHGFVVHPMFLIQPSDKTAHFAKVPLRALLPKGVEGVAVTGLAVSAHRDCMPLIRMQPDIQNQGYAAGYAAAMAVKGKTTFRGIDVRKLQKHLVQKDILPKEVLTETDGSRGVDPNDSHYEIANAFLNPTKTRKTLLARFQKTPELRDALILAFFGEASVAPFLEKFVAETEWDEGWDYFGMGQFGMSSSQQDTAIHALNHLGKGSKAVLKKLAALQPRSHFSHFRAVCRYLAHHPVASAAAGLRNLLTQPEMTGYALNTMQDTIDANRNVFAAPSSYTVNENTFRNAQLKELYLAEALHACAPKDKLGREILERYASSWQGYYSMAAKRALK
ncbi:MAG: FAD-dependent oxidoreductase, partial [Victivallales bacterium]|nr:FAD-dependent oxidoreductase [Victivallales bacterium]